MATGTEATVGPELVRQQGTDDPDDPFYRTPEAWAQYRCLRLTRALRHGSAGMRAMGETYLPKFPKEGTLDYEKRLKRTFLTPAYDDAITKHRSEAFPEPIAINERLDPRFTRWFSNIDLLGNSLDQWAPELFEYGEDDGIVFVIVDKTMAPPGATLADEERLGAQPYVVTIRADDVLGWRYTFGPGGFDLLEFRYLYRVQVPEGLFGSRLEQRVRVWRKDVVLVYAKDSHGNTFLVEEDSRPNALGKVPLVQFVTNPDGIMRGRPYLEQLADKNLEHWQSSSDQRNALQFARIPFTAFAGFSERFVKGITALGSGLKVWSPSPEAKVSVVETTGKAIELGRNDLQDIERVMEALSKAPLLIHPPGQVTATEKAIDTARGASAIKEILVDFEVALNKMVRFMGEWMGVAVAEPPLEVHKDIGIKEDQEWRSEIVKEFAFEGKLGTTIWLRALQDFDVLPDTLTVDEVWESIAKDREAEDKLGPSAEEQALRAAMAAVATNTDEDFAGAEGDTEEEAAPPAPDEEEPPAAPPPPRPRRRRRRRGNNNNA